jgi:ornithine carbamoyltransferase
MLGFRLWIATPRGYEPEKQYLNRARTVSMTHDPRAAIQDADIIYTDVWASMGQEKEAAQRKEIFMPYQINRKLLTAASRDYLIMHCLPAHRGEEITDDVLDGVESIVFDQAENRLHVQKAIMTWLVEQS